MASTSSAADIDPRDSAAAIEQLRMLHEYLCDHLPDDLSDMVYARVSIDLSPYMLHRLQFAMDTIEQLTARAQRAEDALAVAQSDIQHYQHSLQSASNQVEHWKREAMQWTALHGTEGE